MGTAGIQSAADDGQTRIDATFFLIDAGQSVIDAAFTVNDATSNGIDEGLTAIDDTQSAIDEEKSVIVAARNVIVRTSSVIVAGLSVTLRGHNAGFRRRQMRYGAPTFAEGPSNGGRPHVRGTILGVSISIRPLP